MKINPHKIEFLEQRQLLAPITVAVTPGDIIKDTLYHYSFPKASLPNCVHVVSGSDSSATSSGFSQSSFYTVLKQSFIKGDGTPNFTTIGELEATTGFIDFKSDGATVYGNPKPNAVLSPKCTEDMLANYTAMADHYAVTKKLTLDATSKTTLKNTIDFISAIQKLFTTHRNLTFSKISDFVSKGNFSTKATASQLAIDIQNAVAIVNGGTVPKTDVDATNALSGVANIVNDAFYAVLGNGKSLLLNTWIKAAPGGATSLGAPIPTPIPTPTPVPTPLNYAEMPVKDQQQFWADLI